MEAVRLVLLYAASDRVRAAAGRGGHAVPRRHDKDQLRDAVGSRHPTDHRRRARRATARGDEDEPDPAKLAVKAVIALAIFAMVFFSRKRDAVNRGHFLAIVGLTLVNAAVAVFWR